MYKLPEV